VSPRPFPIDAPAAPIVPVVHAHSSFLRTSWLMAPLYSMAGLTVDSHESFHVFFPLGRHSKSSALSTGKPLFHKTLCHCPCDLNFTRPILLLRPSYSLHLRSLLIACRNKWRPPQCPSRTPLNVLPSHLLTFSNPPPHPSYLFRSAMVTLSILPVVIVQPISTFHSARR